MDYLVSYPKSGCMNEVIVTGAKSKDEAGKLIAGRVQADGPPEVKGEDEFKGWIWDQKKRTCPTVEA